MADNSGRRRSMSTTDTGGTESCGLYSKLTLYETKWGFRLSKFPKTRISCTTTERFVQPEPDSFRAADNLGGKRYMRRIHSGLSWPIVCA
jgi:hypothetical protein